MNAYLPMGLTGKARIIRPVPKDEFLTYADVELDESQFAYKLRKDMEHQFSRDIT